MSSSNAKHPELAAAFNKDADRVDWHDETLWWIRQKRDKAAWTIPEWESLRETASAIKNNVLSNLHEYLLCIGLLMQKSITKLYIPSYKKIKLARL
jgi:L-lactate dehydrogenase complex protein LldF